MDISEPTALAKLPRAGLTGDGQTKFCQVYGIRNGLRKKRHEVCATVDGNSLNIFEVVNGRNIASWPVPPDSKFVSNPYSERIQLSKDTTIRKSWCAVQRRGQISVQYYEQRQKGSETIASTKSHSVDGTSPIVRIEPTNDVERTLVLVRQDGTVALLSSTENTLLDHLILQDGPAPLKVLAAQVMTKQEAQSSILKARQDLILSIPDDQPLLTLAYAYGSNAGLRLGIWSLSSKYASDASDTRLGPLLSHDLEKASDLSLGKIKHVQFATSNTKLEVATSTSTTTFNITSIVPQKAMEHKQIVPDQLAKLDLTSDITMYVTAGKIEVYNKKFTSLLAATSSGNTTLKRKRDSDSGGKTALIAYFSQIRRILAFNGTQLLAIDILAREQGQNPFKQSSSLAGNILRGSDKHEGASSSFARYTCSIGRSEPQQQPKDWPMISKDLDALAAQKDVQGFQERFIRAFDLQKSKDLTSSKLPEDKIDYFLSKVFVTDSAGTGGTVTLKVALLPIEVLKWCISGGLLDSHRVAAVLGLNLMLLAPYAVAQALFDTDLIEHYIQHSPYLEAEVLSFVVKSLVAKALDQSQAQTERLLTDNIQTDADDVATTQQLVLGSMLDEKNTSTPTTVCLSYALKRLALTGPAIVSEQLRRSIFSQKDIMALIQFLRQQLFLGGFSRSSESKQYPSPPASDNGEEQNNNPQIPLHGLIILLNGCIDAIGPVGILGSAENEVFIQKMVPELLSEIKVAIDAVTDSSLLQGVLRETLRYAESVERQPFEVRTKVEKAAGAIAPKGRIVTLYAEPDSADSGTLSGSALPLSMKAEEDIDKFKVRKGGPMQRRSAREIGMLKDRLKSPYSFERLVL